MRDGQDPDEQGDQEKEETAAAVWSADEQLRDRDFARYLRLSFARSMGYSTEMLSRPVVGIASTYSEFNNCHRLVPELVAAVKRGFLPGAGVAVA